MIQSVDLEQTAIVNHNFIQQLKKDIQKYDILYIYAPFGWNQEQIISEFYRLCGGKNVFWLEETDAVSLEQQILKIPAAGKKIYLIPHLERIIECGKDSLIWKLLSEKKKGDVFLFVSSMTIPERLLPYTLMNKFISYGIESVRPSNEDVAAYMKSREVLLSQDELFRIEKDTDNIPLMIQMLANVMSGTDKGYRRGVKEQCLEDTFAYIDVVFFRTFSEEDQNALLKLSYFESFDTKLIAYMLDCSAKEAEKFVERMLNKTSVLQKKKNEWEFQPLMKLFLERAIQKYFDFEERMSDYERAMNYLSTQEKWIEALRFAYILQDKERMAYFMSRLLAKNIDYALFVTLEEYFRELSVDNLVQYPELMIAGSILKAITGEMKTAKWYEQQFLNYLASVKDEEVRHKLQSMLLYLYFSRPGNMRDDVLERSMKLLEELEKADSRKVDIQFQPQYISILRGEKDYCHYFVQKEEGVQFLEKFHGVVDKLSTRSYSMMLTYMEAEVRYERNELEKALNLLAKTTREAKISGNERMHHLCLVGMVDLMAAKNQIESTETFRVEQVQIDEAQMPLFYANCQAHTVYYHLLKNQREQIQTWMNNSAPDENELFYAHQYYQYFMKAKVYIWMGQYVRARMILQMLMDFAVEYKMTYLEAQIRLLEAVIYYREGSSLWKEILLPALEWGKSVGFIRIFADEGAAVYELLSRIAQEEKAWEKDGYYKKLLVATKAHMLQYPKYLKQEKQGDVGEFSESEQAVMRLLVLGEKNAEIAARLCVSENTVKYHLKNIYQKLQVTSRGQAITKIREYEIL